MIKPRETIIAAMLARLQTLTTFKTIGREWNGVDNGLNTDSLPALFLIEQPEKHSVRGRGMPAKIDWPFDVILVLTKPEGANGFELLNPYLDSIDGIFQPSAGERAAGVVNLNGNVYDVWIEGTVVKNPAFLGGAACIAVIPLHVRDTNPA